MGFDLLKVLCAHIVANIIISYCEIDYLNKQ